MIEAQSLTKYFGNFQAVNDISFSVGPGKVLAILGPNGAGKTTTIRMLTSILNPSSGTATVAGYDVVKHPAQVRASVGVLTEQHGLYERMRGLDYLDFFGRIYHVNKQTLQKRSLNLMQRFGLGDALDKRVGEYSKGMKQKLALVRALLHDPPVLLLDEPTSAMDPQSARLVRDAIIELKRDHRTIILTTHNLTEAQELSNEIGVIRRGRIIAKGDIESLSQRFIGPPLMELRTTQPLTDDQLSYIKSMANIRDVTDRLVLYETEEPEKTNPQVLRYVMDSGVDVLTLSRKSQTLEEIYLNIVEEDEKEQEATS